MFFSNLVLECFSTRKLTVMAEKALVIILDIVPSKVAKAMEKQKQDCHFQLLGT